MAGLRFSIDRCNFSVLSGWVDREGPVSSLTISLDDLQICELAPIALRPDLVETGFGDGRRSFTFPLSGYLRDGLNRVSVAVDGEEIFSQVLPFHTGVIKGGPIGFGENQQLLDYSQKRWKADEPPEGLTWGRPMTGDSLWEIYREARRFATTDNVLEVGPGYGRLLASALKLNVPFSSYVGLDLSQPRVARLRAKFKQRNVQFHDGDINNWRGTRPFDVVIASVTFDFLYPDCRRALKNLRSQMSPGAHLFVDFIPAAEKSAVFEPSGTFIRCYPEAELQEIFRECGFSVGKILPCMLGEGNLGPVERTVVIAQESTTMKPSRS